MNPVIEWVKARIPFLMGELAKAALADNQKAVDQIRGALMDYDFMLKQFEGQVTVIVEDPKPSQEGEAE